jgi:hypothetical protein
MHELVSGKADYRTISDVDCYRYNRLPRDRPTVAASVLHRNRHTMIFCKDVPGYGGGSARAIQASVIGSVGIFNLKSYYGPF